MSPTPSPPQPHALLFPFPTHGHINPLLALANYLASSDILVTFLHSPRNFADLLANNSHKLPVAHFRNQVFPHVAQAAVDDDGTQQQARTPDQVFPATQQLERELQQMIEDLSNQGLPVSCIISDSFMPWTQDVANKLAIPRVEFWSSSTSGYCIGCSLPQIIATGYLPFKAEAENTVIDFVPGLDPFRVADLPKDVLVDDLSDPLLQFLIRAFSRGKEGERVLLNSFYDLESSAVDAMRAENFSIYPIGPLLALDEHVASFHREDRECLKWLDSQVDSSVIYVSFGSYVSLSNKEMHELALGLEACQQPFLWVIRSDVVNNSICDILPDGFFSRVRDKMCIISWAPQLAILSHYSVGGFFTHCGWNSILESLWAGVPMIGYPQVAEQNTNLNFIMDWKVGMALEGQEKGNMTRESVETTIRVLMQGEEGKVARRRAMELREGARKAIGKGGDSKEALQRFVEDLKQMAATRKAIAEDGDSKVL